MAFEGETDKGGNVRKVLLLMGLSMLGVMLFAAVAGAQGREGDPCRTLEIGSLEFEECRADLGREGDPCGTLEIGSPEFEECRADLVGTVPPNADPCPDPNFPRETPDGCQASNLPDVEFGGNATPDFTATPTSTATPTASPEADDAQYKTASPTVTALPETGGSVSLVGAMLPLALLVGGGLLAFRTVRRS
jgi:LPXTG-motif cell wall-anchored protein